MKDNKKESLLINGKSYGWSEINVSLGSITVSSNATHSQHFNLEFYYRRRNVFFFRNNGGFVKFELPSYAKSYFKKGNKYSINIQELVGDDNALLVSESPIKPININP